MKREIKEVTEIHGSQIVTSYVWPKVSDASRKKFGLSKEDIDSMLLSQRHRCAICGISFRDGYKPVIDHNHKTGEVRGLLCTRCNTAIGLLGDNPQTIDKANDYLLSKGWYGDCSTRYLRGKKRYVAMLKRGEG